MIASLFLVINPLRTRERPAKSNFLGTGVLQPLPCPQELHSCCGCLFESRELRGPAMPRFASLHSVSRTVTNVLIPEFMNQAVSLEKRFDLSISVRVI
jgi:hypothetical protein